jgi:hypothetical protein
VSKPSYVKPGIHVQGVLGNEQRVTISSGGGKDAEASIEIHPWQAGQDRDRSEVYVAVGYFNKKGYWRRAKKGREPEEWMQNAIFDREDFVQAILAVFPELQRAEGK